MKNKKIKQNNNEEHVVIIEPKLPTSVDYAFDYFKKRANPDAVDNITSIDEVLHEDTKRHILSTC